VKEDVHSDKGAKGIAPNPIPTTKAPVVATPPILLSLSPNSAKAPLEAAEDTELAKVRLSVKKDICPITQAL